MVEVLLLLLGLLLGLGVALAGQLRSRRAAEVLQASLREREGRLEHERSQLERERRELTAVAERTRARAEDDAAAILRGAESEAEARRRLDDARAESRALEAEAEARQRVEARSQALLREVDVARAAAHEELRRAQTDSRALREELDRREARLGQAERRVDGALQRLESREQEVEGRASALQARQELVEQAEAALAAERTAALEAVAGMTSEEAKAELLAAVEHHAKREATVLARGIEERARAEAEARARHLVSDALQRVASEQTSESVVTIVHLPGDEMKGRIIGREGRNIRAFEAITGVNLVIDDTPEAVLLSCFDPLRREIARVTLERLVSDGRIHPHRIEETHERARQQVDELCLRAAEEAVAEVGITDLHPGLLPHLGRLRFRTSYGQNVLRHLVESAHIAGLLAAELGVDVACVKRCAFLHDIGKALTHEVEGTHAMVGADLARRHGEHPDVVHAIQAHHHEVEPRTVEALLTIAADAASGGRPGARRESLEFYVARLQRIEELAAAKPGVEKVYAMQAGREVRVMVLPDHVDDVGAQVLARELAKQIEDELTYPGQIRVTVVRESRATEVAR
jgi:ribonuclease Y